MHTIPLPDLNREQRDAAERALQRRFAPQSSGGFIRCGNRLECVDTLGDTDPMPLDCAHAASEIGHDYPAHQSIRVVVLVAAVAGIAAACWPY